MRLRPRYWPLVLAGSLALPGLAAAPAAFKSDGAAQGFVADTDRAMAEMHAGMMVRPTGDVDRDFVQMMVPHHQGAIDMAVAELRYGHDEQLKRIAQEIIVDQQQEIAAMRLALGQPLPPSIAAPTQPDHKSSDHVGMQAGQEK
ncbi:MAG TPA: DUF305 domain-containing protein [Sphingomonas sp.]|uniref:CopM family metallochaperone n=1 Tax=Sphingomonas sp. TaxID=28214 RepID=UPI002CB3E78B|nr:DUF305 domain-containing protein [Sphingomonas sp.]HMI19631.1 DUF305 domain-containing protein [Sphingomonas sp.]